MRSLALVLALAVAVSGCARFDDRLEAPFTPAPGPGAGAAPPPSAPGSPTPPPTSPSGEPEPAPETAAERLSDDMGQSYPEADVEYAYESMTRDQLRKIASERKVPGRGSMNKDELISALRG